MAANDAWNLNCLFERNADSQEPIARTRPFAHRMQSLFHAGELTDVAFSVGDAEQEFRAHRVVLGSISPVFRSMLFGDLFEPSTIINITDLSAEAFRNVLKFAYDEKPDLRYLDQCLQTLYASNKYLIHPLTAICVSKLRRTIDRNNVLYILECAAHLNLDSLMQPCFLCLDANISKLLDDGALRYINCGLWRLILSRDQLPCREYQLFREFNSWVEANRDEITNDEIKELLGLMHFANMPIETLIKCVHPTGLLTTEEVLKAVLENTQNATSQEDICSLEQRRRGLDYTPSHLRDVQRSDLVLFYHTSHVSRRCPTPESLFGYLDFRVNAKLVLRGFQMFGPKKMMQDLSANIVSRVECLASKQFPLRLLDKEATLKACSPLMNTYNYIFPDNNAALIFPNEWYRISINLNSPNYRSPISMCCEPVTRCTDSNVTFIFRKPGSWKRATADDMLPYCSFLAGLHYQLLES